MLDIRMDLQSDIKKSELEEIAETALVARKELLGKGGKGNDLLGWIDFPITYDKKEIDKVKSVAKKIRSDSQVLVVIGVGGSYLGSRAAIEFLNTGKYKNDNVDIYFSGNSFCADDIYRIINDINDRDFSINMISKSGSTMEPSVAFDIFRDLLEEKYGPKEAAKRIYVTTDATTGALREMADDHGYETFVVPDNIGGRFSVLSAVGLLPIAVSGVDVDSILEGALYMRDICINNDFDNNPALKYAALRNDLAAKGKKIEILCNYNSSLYGLSEWWKQLFGESEGKEGKGLFPACLNYTTDLHSIGQFIQEGTNIMFETVLFCEHSDKEIIIKGRDDNSNGLDYLNGKSMDFVNKCAMLGTVEAHVAGGVPNIIISFEEKTPRVIGELFYFFEFACAVSGYMLGINPFDQPGVDFYKNNISKLLGRPE